MILHSFFQETFNKSWWWPGVVMNACKKHAKNASPFGVNFVVYPWHPLKSLEHTLEHSPNDGHKNHLGRNCTQMEHDETTPKW